MATLANKLAANKRFEFASGAFEADKFAVVNMSGFEAISKPFRFTLTLVSDDGNVDFETVLQNPATFRIFAPDGASSIPYYGVLAEFEQLQQSDGYVFYRAVLVPRLWHLSLYQMSEVYLNEQTIPQIIETVLKSSRLGRADYAMKLSGRYRERSFVCQYQETHLDFLSRWMEKEGMYFYFDHDGTAEQLVVVDNRSMHSAQAVKVLYRPVNALDTGSAADSVQDFVCRQKPMPQQVVLRDYNHRKASVELKVSETVSANGIGEVNFYGENFRNAEEGQRYAKLRAEEILCSAKVFTGEATAVGLRSGYFMEMARHYRDSFNGQYLVTEVHHEGSQAGALLAGIQSSYSEGSGETVYRSTFRAIPAATQFRAERTTTKPRVTGTMNATIDAEGSSDYAELDEYGQYKVQLPFDNSDKAAGKGSARVRMASPYAGSDHGMHFPLHKNAEVLLSFIDGDPDQPVILGAVPNSENPSVVKLANASQNKVDTAGGNSIALTDTIGKQTISLYTPGYNTWLTMGAAESKVAMALFPAVSYRVSTAGSMNMFAGGSSVGASRGRSYVNLQGDNSFTLLGTSKMAWQGFFDLSFRGDTSYREDRISIDRLDNYARANNIIRHAEDTVIISAGRKDEEVKKLKELTDKASLVSKMKLALTTAIAVKDVVMVDISKEKEDVTKQPGITKTLLSPAFLALNLAYSFYMKDKTGDIKKQKKDTFHSNLVIGPGGLNMSAGTASVSITREETSSPELPDAPSFFTPVGVANALRNYAIGKPDPKPIGRGETKLEILSKVQNKDGSFSSIQNNDKEISMKVKNISQSEFCVSEEKASISLEKINSSILFDCSDKEVSLKLDKDGIQVMNRYGSGDQTPFTALAILKEKITIEAGKVIKSTLDISSEAAILMNGYDEKLSSKLKLNKDSVYLGIDLVALNINEVGVDIKANGKLIKLG